MRWLSLICVAVFAVALTAFADEPALDEATIQARTAAISKTLRCVVCQNQSIYDSEATLAIDMRTLVEKRVIAGDSDDEVRDYLRERYGDFVLMTPPLQSNTWLLWFGPLVLLVLGGIWFVLRLRTKTVRAASDDLSEDDRARAHAALFGKKDDAS